MIYGLTGKKGSGKSTAARFIQEITGGTRHNFKDALIAELKEKFPDLLKAICWQLDKDVDWLFEYKPPSIRTLMQNYGTNVVRAIDENHWTKEWINNLPLGDVITDDVRFMNEAEAVRNAGGVIIRIEKKGQRNIDTHLSEHEMDLIVPDYTVNVAEGNLPELRRQIEAIVRGEETCSSPGMKIQ